MALHWKSLNARASAEHSECNPKAKGSYWDLDTKAGQYKEYYYCKPPNVRKRCWFTYLATYSRRMLYLVTANESWKWKREKPDSEMSAGTIMPVTLAMRRRHQSRVFV